MVDFRGKYNIFFKPQRARSQRLETLILVLKVLMWSVHGKNRDLSVVGLELKLVSPLLHHIRMMHQQIQA